MFDHLSVVSQNELRREATAVKARRIAEQVVALAQARRDLKTYLDRRDDAIEPELTCGVRNMVPACRVSGAELNEMAAFFEELPRASSLAIAQPPCRPPEDVCSIVEALAQACLVPTRPCPWWSKLLVAHRDRFAGTAIAVAPEEADTLPDVMFCLALATQAPAMATFLQVNRLPVHWPAIESLQGEAAAEWRDRAGISLYGHKWEYYPDVALPFDEGVELVVVDVVWSPGGIACVSRPLSFERFTACLPRPAARQCAERRRGSASPGPKELRQMLRDEFPWLSSADIDKALKNVGPWLLTRTWRRSTTATTRTLAKFLRLIFPRYTPASRRPSWTSRRSCRTLGTSTLQTQSCRSTSSCASKEERGRWRTGEWRWILPLRTLELTQNKHFCQLFNNVAKTAWFHV